MWLVGVEGFKSQRKQQAFQTPQRRASRWLLRSFKSQRKQQAFQTGLVNRHDPERFTFQIPTETTGLSNIEPDHGADATAGFQIPTDTTGLSNRKDFVRPCGQVKFQIPTETTGLSNFRLDAIGHGGGRSFKSQRIQQAFQTRIKRCYSSIKFRFKSQRKQQAFQTGPLTKIFFTLGMFQIPTETTGLSNP